MRERLDDMKILAQHFIDSSAVNRGIKSAMINEHELALLGNYEWPGNIRELKNVIERSLLLGMQPSNCIGGETRSLPAVDTGSNSLELAEVEKQHILKVLSLEGGNKSAAARLLGVSRKTLERKLTIWNSLH